jgi:uncharacterized protein
MQRRITLIAALSATFLAAACAQTKPGNSAKRQQLLIQVSDADPARWNMALNNAKNVQDEVGAANVDIEIVTFGPGVNMLKFDSIANSRVSEAMKAGVQMVVCENTLRNLKMSKTDMIAGVSYANAGVVHIMRRQSEGWIYVRP